MLAQRAEPFIAVVEVCGFNDWLIQILRNYRCHKVILVQPEERKRCKTDRRDAAALSELLWVNRDTPPQASCPQLIHMIRGVSRYRIRTISTIHCPALVTL